MISYGNGGHSWRRQRDLEDVPLLQVLRQRGKQQGADLNGDPTELDLVLHLHLAWPVLLNAGMGRTEDRKVPVVECHGRLEFKE